MAQFSYSTCEEKGFFVARPAGYLDEGAGKVLRKAFEPQLQKGCRKFLLNLSETPVINSQGITQILELAESILYDQKADLFIVGISELYQDVFKAVGLFKLVKIFPDEASAFSSQ